MSDRCETAARAADVIGGITAIVRDRGRRPRARGFWKSKPPTTNRRTCSLRFGTPALVCPSRITIACSTPFVRRRRMPWGWGAVAPRERRDRVGFGEGLDYPRSRVSDTRYTPAMGNSAASAPLSTTDAGSFSAQKRSAARWFWYYTCPIGARGSSLRALHGFRRSPCNEMRHALMSRTRRETHGSHIVADDHHYRAAVG